MSKRIRRRPRGLRSRPFRNRRGLRRGGRRSTKRKFTSGTSVRIISNESATALTVATPISDHLSFIWATIPSNAGMLRQYEGYGRIYDQVKCTRVSTQLWLQESAEETNATYQMPHLRVAYDPDMHGRTVPWESISQLPSGKDIFMRPGVKYNFSFTPLWRQVITDAGNMTNYPTKSPWVDTSNLANLSQVSSNGLLINYKGGPVTLIAKVKYTLQFKIRRNGIVYV